MPGEAAPTWRTILAPPPPQTPRRAGDAGLTAALDRQAFAEYQNGNGPTGPATPPRPTRRATPSESAAVSAPPPTPMASPAASGMSGVPAGPVGAVAGSSIFRERLSGRVRR